MPLRPSRAFALVIVLVLAACRGGAPSRSGGDSAPVDAAPDACAGGAVEDSAPCSQKGATCAYTGPMSRIAPVSVPGEPPLCHCDGSRWACPAVAGLPPPAP
jgi:hypothetical protein